MKSKLTWILAPIMGLLMSFSYAQEKTISGTVTDQMGLALPGVNILVEGTTNGTQTDFDGNYTIQGSEGQTLLFSYIGQMSVTKVIGASSTINVVMQEDAQALEEERLLVFRSERTTTWEDPPTWLLGVMPL